MTEAIVTLNDVSYKYPLSAVNVLNKINLEINQGEFFGLIGPTGAGKTTLCLAMNGIVPQFYGGRFFGYVSVAGYDTVDNPISQLARHVGQVFEDPETQLISTSVRNEIAFAMENLKMSRDEILACIPEVLESVRLSGTEEKHPSELSGGQKQRLAIAAALAVRPDLLVLDEPTSQLDPVGSHEVFETVRELNKSQGRTILMSSHAAEEMAEYADRIAILSKGEIIACGTPDEIYADIERLISNDLRPPQIASTFYLMQKKSIKFSNIPVRISDGKTLLNKIHPQFNVTETHFSTSQTVVNHPVFSVKNLTHVYADGTKALNKVSLDINEGEYVLIVGQNGAGKSTLVKHFLNLLKPTEGSVCVCGTNTTELSVSELACHIGYVAQNPDNQIFNTTVSGEVSFALRNLGYNAEEIETRTTESLKAMGLLEQRSVHPLSLPKGDRARVVIAAILAMKPDTIIFDEPTTGQDYRGARYILDISRELHSMGKTVIVITHHLYLMPDYAQRVIVMGKGTILLDTSIREAFHAVETLKSTYLTPPQSVLLAQHLSQLKNDKYSFITPEEFSGHLLPGK
jgi:energy-coupling factor transport system ATP-binding protein